MASNKRKNSNIALVFPCLFDAEKFEEFDALVQSRFFGLHDFDLAREELALEHRVENVRGHAGEVDQIELGFFGIKEIQDSEQAGQKHHARKDQKMLHGHAEAALGIHGGAGGGGLASGARGGRSGFCQNLPAERPRPASSSLLLAIAFVIARCDMS
ncbi:MAG: hypothetical protein IPK50_07015 [Fibrobacterota bacterium]|nr:MAG: hypothetical protein IPK50_07015 [Fibrobacterota bacterium]